MASELAFGLEGVGKTMIMVLRMYAWQRWTGIQPDHIFSNITVPGLGVRKRSMDEIIERMKFMLKSPEGKIFFVSEADLAFPPRFWNDKEQTKVLQYLYQNRKNNTIFLADTHLQAEKLLKEAARQLWFPRVIERDIENRPIWIDVPGYFQPTDSFPYLPPMYCPDIYRMELYDHLESCY